jgi:hypothetical protein
MTVVAGGTIAALVAADALARAGDDVDLYLPERGVGGGFLPMVVDGQRLELGVRLLELSYGDEDGAASGPVRPPLAGYRPGPSGHRPYVGLVGRFLTELLEPDLVEVDRPRMWVNGRLVPDIYFTVDLSQLRAALTDDQAAAIAAETRLILDETGNPAGVLGGPDPPDLWATSFEDASLANHGPTFHRLFIESVAAKIQAGGSAAVLAALRRKVWLPAFYPQTLWEAASGRPLGFAPNRPFHTVAKGGTGEVVTRLLARLDASPHVTLTRVKGLKRVAADGDRTVLDLDDVTVSAHRPILGWSPEQLFPAAGVEYRSQRLPIGICWALVDEADVVDLPSMTFVVDPELRAYRINSGGDAGPPGRRLVSLELSHHVSPDDAEAVARHTLEAVGLVRPGASVDVVHKVRAPAFTAPSAGNLAAFEAARESFNRLSLDADIIGGATAFGADSLNEQIVQGLRAGERVQ